VARAAGYRERVPPRGLTPRAQRSSVDQDHGR
jgi:hypothetical protein